MTYLVLREGRERLYLYIRHETVNGVRWGYREWVTRDLASSFTLTEARYWASGIRAAAIEEKENEYTQRNARSH